MGNKPFSTVIFLMQPTLIFKAQAFFLLLEWFQNYSLISLCRMWHLWDHSSWGPTSLFTWPKSSYWDLEQWLQTLRWHILVRTGLSVCKRIHRDLCVWNKCYFSPSLKKLKSPKGTQPPLHFLGILLCKYFERVENIAMLTWYIYQIYIYLWKSACKVDFCQFSSVGLFSNLRNLSVWYLLGLISVAANYLLPIILHFFESKHS